jgi:hypothetical protein
MPGYLIAGYKQKPLPLEKSRGIKINQQKKPE